MKQQAIPYLAFDVHPATLVVSVRDEQGSIVMRATEGSGRSRRLSELLRASAR
jgi:hypothetical protein